ncbi:MAG: triose-phosphate isomerase [Phycisphaerae bacterium]
MRRPLVAGNWKMNLNLAEARQLVAGVRAGLEALGPTATKVEVAICPTSIYLFPMAAALDGSDIRLGAQDLYYETKGAFTGEVSAAMVAETGARYAILGHSERRHTIGHLEDDQTIHRKLKAALAAGLTPILCVGETLPERESGQTLDVLTFQLTAALVGVELPSAERLVIAYEPVWAIGTGHNATPQQAQEAHAHLRGRLRELAGAMAEGVRILYGGSVKPDNAAGLMTQPDVDGGLIGGASLKADAFLGIIRATLAAAG